MLNNSGASIAGTVYVPPEYSHEAYGEKFYQCVIETLRKSGTADYIPVIISEKLIDPEQIRKSDYLSIVGTIRTHGNNGRLELSVWAESIICSDELIYTNEVMVHGNICRKPVRRMTAFGRNIADCIVAVNRNYNKASYIPCILWGRNANYAERLSVGDEVTWYGRLQSRVYTKNLEERTVYELSVNEIERKDHDNG